MKTEKTPKPKWVDKTNKLRAAKRRAQLDAIATRHGFSTWVKLETTLLNGATLTITSSDPA